MSRKLLITVGGTGGHVYPALSLAHKIKKMHPNFYIMFAGGGLCENRFFDQEAFPYHEVASGHFPLRNPLICMRSVVHIAKGFRQSDKILKDFQPDAVVGFGSYHTLPILLAAKMRGIPIVLHESNSIPGRVNRLLSKHAVVTGVQFPLAAQYLKGKTEEVGMPLRNELSQHATTRAEALSHYGLSLEAFTILIFGGSQGALAINRLIAEAFEYFPTGFPVVQVIHFTGDSHQTEYARHLYAHHGIKAHVQDYERNMERAWRASDLLISRSGAGTIAEQIEYEVPAIFIPYPHAMDDHQAKNADYVVGIGGAIKLDQKGLTPFLFARELFGLLSNGERLEQMRYSLHIYKESKSQKDLSEMIVSLLKK